MRRLPALCAAAVILLAAACDGPDRPELLRGTWAQESPVARRTLTLSDSTLQLDVTSSVGGGASLRFSGLRVEPASDHYRVTFEGLLVESPGARVLVTGDSTVVREGEETVVTTDPDSLMDRPGRLVLVPRADSSVVLGLPATVLQAGGLQGFLGTATLAWPDSAGALEASDGWRAVEYSGYSAADGTDGP